MFLEIRQGETSQQIVGDASVTAMTESIRHFELQNLFVRTALIWLQSYAKILFDYYS